MSSDSSEHAKAMAIAPESPQPLPLTANSSRCTSPLSPPSDPNASASSVDEENITTLNLSLPSKSLNNSVYISNSNSNKQLAPVSNHINHSDPNCLFRLSHKYKNDNSSVSRGRSKPSNQMSFSSDNHSSQNYLNNPELFDLLLEYRQVLLDVLAKSILLGEKEPYDPNCKSVTLPLKCSCGFTSKLSNQITRSSTYVHQLELRYRSLMETSRANESKYTPKRPWFINANSLTPSTFPNKSSLLDKKPMLPRQSNGKQVSLFRSGTSSINSSLNGDDDEVDSDEDDVNDDNLTGNLNNFNNGSFEELNGGGKTILEGYLESMKNEPIDDGYDDDEKHDADDEDIDGIGEDLSLRGLHAVVLFL